MRLDKFQKAAWSDGWKACGTDSPKHIRPNYQTHGERVAFSKGWEERAERIACGYDLPASYGTHNA